MLPLIPMSKFIALRKVGALDNSFEDKGFLAFVVCANENPDFARLYFMQAWRQCAAHQSPAIHMNKQRGVNRGI